MRSKKYLFLSVLATASISTCLIIYLCILEKSKEFERTIGEIEMVVPVLNNEFYPEKGSNKRLFIKYEDMLEIVKRCNNVSGIIVEYSMAGENSADIVLSRNKKQSQGISKGVSADYDRLMGLTIKKGRFFEKGDEEGEICVILQSLAKELDAKVSDTVEYMGKELKIIGIVAEKKPFDTNIDTFLYGVYLPIKIKRQLHNEDERIYYSEETSIIYSDGIPYIRVYLVSDPGKRELVYQEVGNLLENKYGKEKEFLFGDAETSMSGLVYEKILWAVGLLLIFGISLLINKKCLSKFLLSGSISKNQLIQSSVKITLIGAVLGVILGKGICFYLMIDPKVSLFSMVLAISINLIFGLLVAARTKKALG